MSFWDNVKKHILNFWRNRRRSRRGQKAPEVIRDRYFLNFTNFGISKLQSRYSRVILKVILKLKKSIITKTTTTRPMCKHRGHALRNSRTFTNILHNVTCRGITTNFD